MVPTVTSTYDTRIAQNPAETGEIPAFPQVAIKQCLVDAHTDELYPVSRPSAIRSRALLTPDVDIPVALAMRCSGQRRRRSSTISRSFSSGLSCSRMVPRVGDLHILAVVARFSGA
jgi:hypothetical protein